MSSQEPSNTTMTCCEYSDTAEVQEKDVKANNMRV